MITEGEPYFMIRIAICDDNIKVANILEKKVRSILDKKHIPAELIIYVRSELLLYDAEEGKHFDLILSDIEMPDVNGMQLASKIRLYLPKVMIFFITAHMEYAIDSYSLNIFRYIPKNELDSRLPHALYDVVQLIQLQENQYYTIQTHNCMEKILYRDIILIQRNGKNSVLTLPNNQTRKIRISLSHLYQEFDSQDFIFINRSDIVNLSHIIGIYHNNVKLTDNIILPISESRLDSVKKSLTDFWGNMF